MLVVAGLANVVGVQELLQKGDEPHRIDRLLQIIARSQLESFDRAGHRHFASDEDHRRRSLDLSQLPNEIDTARTREMQIGDYDIDRMTAKNPHRLFG